MTTYRTGEVAELLGISADRVRRLADNGELAAIAGDNGQRTFDSAELARFARARAEQPDEAVRRLSARNRIRGIVTAITRSTVMAQVDIQAGPFRMVSLMSREAADELGLEVGSTAYAVIKSTNVFVEGGHDG